jgi:hypothetical protein
MSIFNELQKRISSKKLATITKTAPDIGTEEERQEYLQEEKINSTLADTKMASEFESIKDPKEFLTHLLSYDNAHSIQLKEFKKTSQYKDIVIKFKRSFNIDLDKAVNDEIKSLESFQSSSATTYYNDPAKLNEYYQDMVLCTKPSFVKDVVARLIDWCNDFLSNY